MLLSPDIVQPVMCHFNPEKATKAIYAPCTNLELVTTFFSRFFKPYFLIFMLTCQIDFWRKLCLVQLTGNWSWREEHNLCQNPPIMHFSAFSGVLNCVNTMAKDRVLSSRNYFCLLYSLSSPQNTACWHVHFHFFKDE